MTGIVKWFDDQRGYGFISNQEGDFFVHWKYIVGVTGHKSLFSGDRVQFDLEKNNAHGHSAMAINVLVLQAPETEKS